MLDHEDLGMMGVAEIVGADAATPGPAPTTAHGTHGGGHEE
jgi:hypothetical protein